ncbi:hypothetical protein YSY43_11470 [Paenibacillus sp. YSY-4.3]
MKEVVPRLDMPGQPLFLLWGVHFLTYNLYVYTRLSVIRGFGIVIPIGASSIVVKNYQ